MSWQKYPLNLPIHLYDWLKKYAHDMGESMATIIRKALNDYKKNHEG